MTGLRSGNKDAPVATTNEGASSEWRNRWEKTRREILEGVQDVLEEPSESGENRVYYRNRGDEEADYKLDIGPESAEEDRVRFGDKEQRDPLFRIAMNDIDGKEIFIIDTTFAEELRGITMQNESGERVLNASTIAYARALLHLLQETKYSKVTSSSDGRHPGSDRIWQQLLEQKERILEQLGTELDYEVTQEEQEDEHGKFVCDVFAIINSKN